MEPSQIQDAQEATFNYSLKKPKSAVITSQDNQIENDQRIKLPDIPPVKTEYATKNLELIYTNKLFEVNEKRWSDDLTQDEFEKTIRDFDAFARTCPPEIRTAPIKGKLKKIKARFSYLINKWDISIDCLL